MKKLQKTFLLLTFILLLFPSFAFAKDFGTVENVSKNNSWTINFTTPINPVNLDKYIIIRDSTNRTAITNLSISNGGKTVTITPLIPYISGETYTLMVAANLPALNGGYLKDPSYIKFTVEQYTPTTTLPQFTPPEKGEEIAVMNTNKGIIKIQLFPESAPKAVENFKTHARNGYYNGLTFHRVIKDFMIQSGDPVGNGTGGESIWTEPFADEFDTRLHNFRGALSMANSGPNTSRSQIFIVQSNTAPIDMINEMKYYGEPFYPRDVISKYEEVGGAPWLDYRHTVFGQVFQGMDIVDSIASVKVDSNSKPVDNVIINSIQIVTY